MPTRDVLEADKSSITVAVSAGGGGGGFGLKLSFFISCVLTNSSFVLVSLLFVMHHYASTECSKTFD